FDAAFFRISPKEAEMMDPQQRILLELSWSCLEDAGILPESLKNSDTGVFIGASGSDYAHLLYDAGVEVEAHLGTGSSLAVLANRISYFFDFSGPSLQIDTACSSSLVAVHTAVQSLRRGECSMALVGGVNLICHPALSMAYYKAGMLAPDGRCKAFDARANGYVRSEGAVMLVLKPVQKAIEERDFFYGVIKGSAINHGGLSGGLTVPNPQKQSELLMSAWKNAGINPEDLSYLEAHGTGTSLGDPIEVQGIRQAVAELSKPEQVSLCGLGSIKSNLGHLEAAAGIAGLLKIVLSMQRKQIPGSIHFNTLNPKIELDDTSL
ncbi:MAG: polyketide synthase, partial [Planctomycetes bacterium]|nr:polyketide synthase [Planctomycetota bacterium]